MLQENDSSNPLFDLSDFACKEKKVSFVYEPRNSACAYFLVRFRRTDPTSQYPRVSSLSISQLLLKTFEDHRGSVSTTSTGKVYSSAGESVSMTDSQPPVSYDLTVQCFEVDLEKTMELESKFRNSMLLSLSEKLVSEKENESCTYLVPYRVLYPLKKRWRQRGHSSSWKRENTLNRTACDVQKRIKLDRNVFVGKEYYCFVIRTDEVSKFDQCPMSLVDLCKSVLYDPDSRVEEAEGVYSLQRDTGLLPHYEGEFFINTVHFGSPSWAKSLKRLDPESIHFVDTLIRSSHFHKLSSDNTYEAHFFVSKHLTESSMQEIKL